MPSPVGTELLIEYARAKAVNPSLTKTQFMMETFPQRYHSRDAAYQAFNQTTKGKRSGVKLGEEARRAQPPIKNKQLLADIQSGKKKRHARPGGHERGLWKVNIVYLVLDEDGNEKVVVKSFIAMSDKYQTLFNVAYLNSVLQNAADQYENRWLEMYEDDEVKSINNYLARQIEVVPIYRTDIAREDRYDIDTETFVKDDLDIEEY